MVPPTSRIFGATLLNASTICGVIIATSPANLEKTSDIGLPISSSIWPIETLILSMPPAVADAAPLTCVSIALRTWSKVLARLPVWANSAEISLICEEVKAPVRLSAASPFSGSSSALPSCTAYVEASPPKTAAISTDAWVARSNAPPVVPAVLANSLKVASFACAAMMRSPSTPVASSVASATLMSRSATSLD